MTWGAPMLAALVAAIAVPALIALYLLRLRRREVEISSTLLWRRAVQDLQANAPFQRLRRNLLLLLQLLALAAAIAAVAQPRLAGQSATGARHVIMIDASASMSSLDGEPGGSRTRLQAAQREALNIVDALRGASLFSRGEADQAMVISFAAAPEVHQPFTSDKALLRAAIESIQPWDAPTLIEDAMRVTRAHAPRRSFFDETTQSVHELPPGPVGTIHVISDGRIADASRAAPHPEDVVLYHRVGTADAGNVGITSIRAGRAFNDPGALSVFVGLVNTAPTTASADVELAIDGVIAGIRPVELPAAGDQGADAPGTGGVVFALQRPDGGVVTVLLRTTSPNVMPADDDAWLVVPPARRLAVALVTRGNIFVREALAGMPPLALTELAPEAYEALSPADRARFDVVILDSFLPQRAPGVPAPLPPGRFLVLGGVPPPPAGLRDTGRSALTHVIDWKREHPALRGVVLDGLVMEGPVAEVADDTAGDVIASSSTGPAIVDVRTAQTRALVLPFAVQDSNWPFDVSFVLFLAQAVRYLGDDDDAAGRSLQPGHIISDVLPPGARSVRMTDPAGGSAAIVPGVDGRIAFGPLRRSGVYVLSWEGEALASDHRVGSRVIRAFAANLADPSESLPAAAQTISLATSVVGARDAGSTRTPRPLWPWALLACFVVLMLEWNVYTRRARA